MLFRLLLDPSAQGAEGNGSSSTQVQNPAPAQTPPATPPAQSDPNEGFKKLLEKHQNDSARVAEKLYDENHSYRQQLRELRGKVPAEGSLVLTADQAKAWSSYLELGTPESITTLKSEHSQFATERQAAAREKLHGEAAEAHGFKASVLSRLINQDGVEIEIKESTENGKTAKTAVVKHGDKTTPLPDYAKANWSDFEAALSKTPETKPIGTPRLGSAPAGTNSTDTGRSSQEQSRKSFVR